MFPWERDRIDGKSSGKNGRMTTASSATGPRSVGIILPSLRPPGHRLRTCPPSPSLPTLSSPPTVFFYILYFLVITIMIIDQYMRYLLLLPPSLIFHHRRDDYNSCIFILLLLYWKESTCADPESYVQNAHKAGEYILFEIFARKISIS